MKKNFVKIASLTWLLPVVTLAQGIENVLDPVRQVINSLVPIAMTLAFLAFIWGLFRFIMNAGDPAKKAEGKHIMLWGVVALFVMASIWGLTGLIGDIFGIGQGQAPDSGQLTPQ